jgi:hypothetical protein
MAQIIETTSPDLRYTGLRYLLQGGLSSIVINFSYKGVAFHVLASADDKDHPPGYDIEGSIEGEIVEDLDDLAYDDETEEKDQKRHRLHCELTSLAEEACISLMRELGPATPLLEPRTLQEWLYPESHVLQILTENGTLVGRKLDSYELPDRHPPIPEAKLLEMGLEITIPVFKPSEVVLGPRLQSLVWRVTVHGQDMICKASRHFFQDAICDELATYNKLRKHEAASSNELRIPELKGEA